MKAVWNAADSDSEDETCKKPSNDTQSDANFRCNSKQPLRNGDSDTESGSSCSINSQSVLENEPKNYVQQFLMMRNKKFSHTSQAEQNGDQGKNGYPSKKNSKTQRKKANKSAVAFPNPAATYHHSLLRPELQGNNDQGQSYRNRHFPENIQDNPAFSSNHHRRGHRNPASFQKQATQNQQRSNNDHNFKIDRFCAPSEYRTEMNPPRPVILPRIGFKRLRDLVDEEPHKILFTLLLPESGLGLLLDSFMQLENFMQKRDMLALLLIALGKACRSDYRKNLMILINTVISNPMFMLCTIQQYLATFQTERIERLQIRSLESLLEFLTCYNQLLPSSACETLSVMLSLLKTTCRTMQLTYPDIFNSSTKTIAELEQQKDDFLKGRSDVSLSVASQAEKLQLAQPPNNFRTISILPTNDDIWNDQPFLRPNVTDGKYCDMEHYLDVQFRLLREDYVRPLREGIATYLHHKKNRKSLKNCKDVKIYTDVHIIQQEFTKGNLVHLASFNVADFSRVNWEFSKRFLSGSLICLSHDDFQHSYFASVAFRDVKKLKEGILILKFEDLSDDVLSFTSSQTFVVIETDAYFEAYRHNLSALQKIENDRFPLRNYIVDAHKEVKRPAYLTSSTTYDMGPIFQSLENCKMKLKSSVSPVVSIQISDDQLWPTAKELHLDESQYKALKAAITKEFTVIQGPPGTGKTYIGLRIVQLLLHNISSWKSSQASCPILIVCYTNHALDQFLEGVVLFTKNIVRVGGRCANEKLSCYQLDNRRRLLQEKRQVPRYIYSNIRSKNAELHRFGKELNVLQKRLSMSEKKILTEEELVDHINSNHYDSLISGVLQLKTGSNIHYWLDIGMPQPLLDEFQSHADPLIPGSMQIAQCDATQHVGNHTVYGTEGGGNNLGMQFMGHNGINNNQAMAINVMPSNGIAEVNEDEEDLIDVEFIEDMRGIGGEEFRDITIDPMFMPDVDDDIPMADGWHVQGGQKKLKAFITKRIKLTVPLTEKDVVKITDIWNLNSLMRWRLYKYWLELFLKAGQKEILQLQQKIRTEYDEINEMKMEENLNILRDAEVVGMTTTGAAKYRKMVQHLNPRIVIVEEAAEILESHIITSLAEDTQHIILIGDHQQLRPSPNVYDLAVKYNLDVSLFERMVKNGMNFQQLSIQHRMHPSIASLLVPHIYQNLENHESVHGYEPIKGVCKSLFFITHEFTENQEFDSKSKVNMHEAYFMAALCRYFVLQGYHTSQITVLTTYSGQMFALKNLMRNTELLKDVRITVVDNFQGEENDIILISFVRSNEDGIIGFLKVVNRVCVALSRAKKGLFAIGNFTLLAKKSDLWKNIVASLKQQDAIGTSLSLMCQNHPGTITSVSKSDDFNKVPEGGCMLPCEYRLQCGHTCASMCHTYDSSHESIQCRKSCNKILCEKGHKCNKQCYKACGPCISWVEKEIPDCKHKVQVPCYLPPELYSCSAECEKKLLCGHSCKMPCGKKCTYQCTEGVDTKLQCGHTVKIPCFDVVNKSIYAEKCNARCCTELQCGHICSGTCGCCYQGRLHQICKQPCKRILVCGHECKAKCSTNCPPCKRKCENRCVHSQCPNLCGEPCAKCKEPCQWSCEHLKCSKECGELCDRRPCDMPCTKKLECGHYCIGLCGEPCPSECATCNPKVTEIFFGSEDSEDARFIELEDCKHIFEIEGMTHWMKMAEERKGEIQMKACPRCKTVIRKNLRFGNVVKACLADIERVKSKIFGQVDANKKKVSTLIKRLKNLEHFEQEELLKPLQEVLKKKGKKMGNPDIIRSENVISMMDNYLEFEQFYRQNIQSNSTRHCKSVEVFTILSCHIINTFISEEFLTASEQQLQELSWEIQRLKLIRKYLEFRYVRTCNLTSENMEICKKIETCLCKLGPFHSPDEKQFCDKMKDLMKGCDTAIINLNDVEKKSILQAMNLSQGHWYMCPNGHVYCITECGGAVVEGICNECNATIGGQSHALRNDNRLARDMDGASHSAWPQTYDLGNYEEFN